MYVSIECPLANGSSVRRHLAHVRGLRANASVAVVVVASGHRGIARPTRTRGRSSCCASNPGPTRVQTPERLQQQSGAEQQRQRRGDLRDDEHPSNSTIATSRAGPGARHANRARDPVVRARRAVGRADSTGLPRRSRARRRSARVRIHTDLAGARQRVGVDRDQRMREHRRDERRRAHRRSTASTRLSVSTC